MGPGHTPVLLAQALELLDVRPDGFYVDGTLGLAGHAREILLRSAPHGRLLGLDRDAEALERASLALAPFADRVQLRHADFRELPELVGDGRPDGILLDLGVSSLQLDSPERGFSFRHEGPLDMRLDRSGGPTADELVNRLPERELADIIHHYGEERGARRVARAIVTARARRRLATTLELAEVVRRSLGGGGRARLHPATRTFQALRIQVNRELEGLDRALAGAARTLAPGGRLAVIAFHSLEDRQVKQAFLALAAEGFQRLTRKPVRPDEAEVRLNPRARSARLRALARPSRLPEAA